MTLVINGSTGITYPAGGTDNVAGAGVGTTDTQTLSNKTISGNLNMTGGSKYQVGGVTTNALAWVNFNGGNGNTAGVINASYNVSSITVNGTGDYTVNITSALPNANYVVTGMSDWSATGNVAALRYISLATSSFGVRSIYATSTLFNPTTVAVAVFGN